MAVVVVDSVADRTYDAKDVPADLHEARASTEFKLGHITVKFADQDGSGHYFGAVTGPNVKHVRRVATLLLKMLTATARD